MPSSSSLTVAAEALLAFLESEAESYEDKAKRLRSKLKFLEEGGRKTGWTRSKTGYMMYFSDKREGMRDKHPDVPSNQILKLVAQQWQEESDEVKQDYKRRADELQEMERPSVNHPPPKKARKLPVNSYQLYVAAIYEETKQELGGSAPSNEVLKRIAAKWKEEPPEVREEYQQKLLAEREAQEAVVELAI